MSRTAFRSGIEKRDIAAVVEAMAEDVTFHSPVMVHPYQGRETVRRLLTVLAEVFQDFRYTDELLGEADGVAPDRGRHTRALVFRATIAEKDIQGLDLLTYDQAGRISDLTVMVRPLPAAMTLARMVGARMQEAEAGS